MDSVNLDDLLRSGEAARLVGVDRKTIARWADHCHLPCIVTLGGHRRFRRGDVMRLISERRDVTPPS